MNSKFRKNSFDLSENSLLLKVLAKELMLPVARVPQWGIFFSVFAFSCFKVVVVVVVVFFNFVFPVSNYR